MLERFELRRTGLKHKKINKKYFYSDFIFCEKACYACYRGGDLSKKGPLRFELVLRGKRINRKKLNVKTLSRPRIKRTYQSSNSNMCHLDMAAGQRHGVKLSNSKIANYNSSRITKAPVLLELLHTAQNVVVTSMWESRQLFFRASLLCFSKVQVSSSYCSICYHNTAWEQTF